MREDEAEEVQAPVRMGLCLHCRQMKPDSLFQKNAAGSLTAWCESCRMEKAKKWNIEEDQVEIAYALYVLEESFKAEALAQAKAEGHAAEVSLAQAIKIYDLNRPFRIPSAVRKLIEESRAHFYAVLGLPAPERITLTAELI